MFDGVKELVFACYFTKQYNSSNRIDFCVFKVDLAELANYVVGKKEAGRKNALSKFEGVEMNMIVFPEKIKYEVFTYAYFTRMEETRQVFFRSSSFVS